MGFINGLPHWLLVYLVTSMISIILWLTLIIIEDEEDEIDDGMLGWLMFIIFSSLLVYPVLIFIFIDSRLDSFRYYTKQKKRWK